MRPIQAASQKIVDFLNKNGDISYKAAIAMDASLAQFARPKYDGVKFQWKTGKLGGASAKPAKKTGVTKVMKKGKKATKVVVAPKRRNQVVSDFGAALKFVETHGSIAKARAYIAAQRAELDAQELLISEVEAVSKQVRAVA